MILAASGDFFTGDALATFGGVTLATVVVGNAITIVTKRDIKLIPFIVALGLCLLRASSQDALDDAEGWIVAVVNGCLVFCTAAGVQVTALISSQGTDAGRQRTQALQGRRIPWLRSWVP